MVPNKNTLFKFYDERSKQYISEKCVRISKLCTDARRGFSLRTEDLPQIRHHFKEVEC